MLNRSSRSAHAICSAPPRASSLAPLCRSFCRSLKHNFARSATRTALEQIAGGANLMSSQGAAAAVRESARYMIRSRLSERYRDTEHGTRLIEEMSEYVTNDKSLKAKLLAILKRIKTG